METAVALGEVRVSGCRRGLRASQWRLAHDVRSHGGSDRGASLSGRTGTRHSSAAVVLMVLAVAGCATVPAQAPPHVALSLNAASYQIGEPVVATVQVANESKSELVVPALDATTLKFYSAQPGGGVPIKSDPVLPGNLPGESHVLAPRGSVARAFLFTQLTQEPGEWGLVAVLSGCRRSGAGEAMVASYSETAPYRVGETVAFERDRHTGLITRNQAILLARNGAGLSEDAEARALLMPLADSGLSVWVVLLGGGEKWLREAAAFTVNPYSGSVRALEPNEPLQEGQTQ